MIEFDVEPGWFHRTVQSKVLDGSKQPSATEMRVACRTYVENKKLQHELQSKKQLEQQLKPGLVKVVTGWDGSKAKYEHVAADRAHKLGESMSILKADFITLVYGQRATQRLQDAGGSAKERLELVYKLACDEVSTWTTKDLLSRVKQFFGYEQPRRETQVYVSQDKFESLTQRILGERGQAIQDAWGF